MSIFVDEPKVVPFSETETTTDKNQCAHIVKTEDNEIGTAKVLEARIYGLVIEALCGHRWVPTKDPKQLPICEECKEVYETYKMFNGGLNDGPSA